MPRCPECREDVKRKEGACPRCGQALSLHNGRYYREEDGSPAKKVLNHFDELLSRKTSKLQNLPIVIRTSPKMLRYKRELGAAERFLELADGDLDLVRLVLDVLFTNQQFERRDRSPGLAFIHDFDIALPVALSIRARQDRASERQDTAFNQVTSQEDLFS